jgi:hypothetical protein
MRERERELYERERADNRLYGSVSDELGGAPLE